MIDEVTATVIFILISSPSMCQFAMSAAERYSVEQRANLILWFTSISSRHFVCSLGIEIINGKFLTFDDFYSGNLN